jgi:hypothetical protein
MTRTDPKPILGESFAPAWLAALDDEGYSLRRAWPRGRDHLLFEVVGEDGERVAGQWFTDLERTRTTARRTPGSRRVGETVLQPHGADRSLHGLSELVSTPGHRLVAHRPEKRAVVAAPGRFVKFMRPQKLAPVLQGARLARDLDIGAPEVLGADAAAGTLTTRALPGRPLSDLVQTDQAAQYCVRAGRTVAELHARPLPRGVSIQRHGPGEELAVVKGWKELAGRYTGRDFDAAPRELPAADPDVACLLHRDLHDGQMIFSEQSNGILDLDLLAVGHPALDVGNFLAHVQLRGEQGRLGIGVEEAEQAFLEGYRPTQAVLQAVEAYREAARQRLRAVYSLRNTEMAS